MSLKPKQVVLLQTNSLCKSYGLNAAALNLSCVAAGMASHAEGYSSRAGQFPNPFTIPAGGTLVTIAGDQRAQYTLSEKVRIAPTGLPVVSGVVNSAPVFAAGNTTFNLAAPINTVSTSGEIVLSSDVGFGRGLYAHAEGRQCVAEGFASSAKGATSFAYGVAGTAEGAGGWSFGHAAHAEGEVCVAGGTDSYAGGIGNVAMGTGSHAEGAGSAGRWVGGVAGGHGSHAEGSFTRAGNNIHTFTIVPNGTLVTIPGNVVAEFNIGDSRIPFLPLTPQTGCILYGDIADQPVFAAGNTTFNLTVPLSTLTIYDGPGVGLVCTGGYTCGTTTGVGAHAEGNASIASANASHAEGGFTKALSVRAHAEGSETVASGENSHAEGEFSIASGVDSHAEGKQTLANGLISHAEGSGSRCGNLAQNFTIAAGGVTVTIVGNVTAQFTNGASVDIDPTTPTITGLRVATRTVASVPAFAAGNTTFNLNTAIDAFTTGGTIVNPNIGVATHAEGRNCIASASYAHAEGDTAIASGQASHAEGGSTIASGINAHAEGVSCTASGNHAHAEGYQCVSSGLDSHTEGELNQATAVGAHAEGAENLASGAFSHAEGRRGTAAGPNSHTSGDGAFAATEDEDAFAGGKFSVVGDAQLRRQVIKGLTPGSAAGETTLLVSGTSGAVYLTNLKSYMCKLRGVATKMGLGVAVRQSWAFEYDFTVDVAASVFTISALVPLYSLVTGAAFVGATITIAQAGPTALNVNFNIAGGLTIQSRIVGYIELVEVLGT